MIDESKIIVLGSLSLRASRTRKTNAAYYDVLEHSSVAVAGYQHSGGQWGEPTDLSYVTIHV